MPTAGDVQAELEARAKLATGAAIGAVKHHTQHARRATEHRLPRLGARERSTDVLAAAGRNSHDDDWPGTVSDTPPRAPHRGAAGRGGSGSRPGGAPPQDPLGDVLHNARDMAEQFARSRAAPGVALVSAFAVGLALANLFGGDDEDDGGEDEA